RPVSACQQAGGDPRDRFLLASKRPWLRARSPSGKKRARLGSINYPPAATPGRGRYCIVTRYGGIASRSGNKEFSLTDPVNVAVVVGSLRKVSMNRKAAVALTRLAPDHMNRKRLFTVRRCR